jgi:hypothetical protein
MTTSEGPGQTRRSFVKTAAYVAPAILTLRATPARAQQTSLRFATEQEKLSWYQQWVAEQTNQGGGGDHHHDD